VRPLTANTAKQATVGDMDDLKPQQGGRRDRTVTLGPVAHPIQAPPALVYQMLAAIGQRGTAGGERAEILERTGDMLICDFWTRVTLPGGIDRLVRTRERVILHPPDAVEYEHLDGPVSGLREQITVVPDGAGASLVTYRGAYRPQGLVDYLRALVLVRPVMGRVMREHFADLRDRAEARAARSRVFRTDPAASHPPVR
jgi:hypothetical protein